MHPTLILFIAENADPSTSRVVIFSIIHASINIKVFSSFYNIRGKRAFFSENETKKGSKCHTTKLFSTDNRFSVPSQIVNHNYKVSFLFFSSER
jgi:hypothetical protein